jgi:peptidyl-prolyl cis-trans isomerase C|tara:strand:- start:1174 stop:1968 length:795 start_codon:yes stop_codon:yes gene_type:complete
LKYKIPLFFVIGIILYLIDITFNSDNEKEIFISDQEIISLVSAWRSQVGRNPNDDEITRIINNLVEEEILYREALKLGLDKEDRIIKRRLAQKISFLRQESIPNSPSNDDLIKFFNDNREKYFINATYTFTHYFFSLEENSEERSLTAYNDLMNNKNIKADPFFLGKNFVDVNLRKIQSEFGDEFSSYFNNIELNKWIGPIQSPFGHHIIYVNNYKEGYIPDITNVLKQVEVDLLQDKRDKALKEYLNDIKSEYTIYINPELQI